ncbi:hypothetical protein E4U21_005562 [Claviceps maximensis]|nr:hypothetical protein E4U21_005562 [Claviceps maximensis]
MTKEPQRKCRSQCSTFSASAYETAGRDDGSKGGDDKDYFYRCKYRQTTAYGGHMESTTGSLVSGLVG